MDGLLIKVTEQRKMKLLRKQRRKTEEQLVEPITSHAQGGVMKHQLNITQTETKVTQENTT